MLRIFGGLTVSILILAVIFIMFAADHRVEGVKATWRRTIGDNGQICLDAWKSSLKDPQSTQLLSTTPRGEDMIMVKYRATNSYGAYTTGFFDCPIKNGSVDTFAITMQRSDEALEEYRRTQ